MSQQEKSFSELLAEAAENDKSGLVISILENAKQGDGSALRILEKSFAAASAREEERVKISPEQYRQIIQLAAERLKPSE